MKILADENIARQIVLRLRAEGHDVSFIMEMARSSDDDVVLQLATLAKLCWSQTTRTSVSLSIVDNSPRLALCSDDLPHSLTTRKRNWPCVSSTSMQWSCQEHSLWSRHVL